MNRGSQAYSGSCLLMSMLCTMASHNDLKSYGYAVSSLQRNVNAPGWENRRSGCSVSYRPSMTPKKPVYITFANAIGSGFQRW